MATFRVATFNCENLFSRPKVFQLPSAKSKPLLKAVADLHVQLAKPVFDQKKIAALKKQLKGFATINDVRHKHTSKGMGAEQWLGWIEFARDKVNDVAIQNTAQVIVDVNADVFCLIEVENRPHLQKFHDEVVLKTKATGGGQAAPYKHILLIDGNDERGIDVAVMSRLPVRGIRSHIHETTDYLGKTVRTFSRDCLEIDIELPGGEGLTAMFNHFKSMGYSPPADPQSEKRRRQQAERVAKLVDGHKPQTQLVVVAGDLNSPPTANSMQPLVSHADLYNVNLNLPAGQRGTYKTNLDNKQLDYLFVSTPLKNRLQRVYIERRGCYKTKWPVYPTVVDDRTSASDHCAVVAEFSI